jgi:predicted HicB family RNase H-like nuclease
MTTHGGARPGAGRRPTDNPRGARIMVRVTEQEHALLTAAAARNGVSVSEWVRNVAVKAVLGER